MMDDEDMESAQNDKENDASDEHMKSQASDEDDEAEIRVGMGNRSPNKEL